MITFGQAFAGAGAGSTFGGWASMVLTSKTITFTQAGKVCLTVVSAGGSGAKTASTSTGAATGGNSGPWGRKVFAVGVGDTLTFTIGSGGAAQTANGANGNPGGTTTIALNGSTIITAPGAEGGVAHASAAVAPAPVATITGCDFYVPGVQAGKATGTTGVGSGGAAVDALKNGTGRSLDSTSSISTAGGSVGTDLGGETGIPWLALFDFGFATGDGRYGSAGVCGDPSNSTQIGGPLAGGSARWKGGLGGGGGGGISSGSGGNAFCYLIFQPEA